MSGVLEAVTASGPVFRLARAPDPWAWPDWSHAGLDGTFGNRWDDSEGEYRVLYASSTRFGALLETLARFRPDLAAVAAVREIGGDGDALAAGTVPSEWFGRRVMGVAELAGSYADIGAAASLATIRSQLAARALHHGLADVDAGAIRVAAPRAFTQEMSRLVYGSRDAEGEAFAGIRYRSRFDDGTDNWAVFEPAPGEPASMRVLEAEPVQPHDPDVTRALAALGLRVQG
ncbi:MAG: RES family NAD+ phosphorylase [Chloroflexi bacterium]|nr:RES family NAD+ phosphorylase [Chloroflexota bacterium]